MSFGNLETTQTKEPYVQNNQIHKPTRERKLDQERAQSMADEGGVSGAEVEAQAVTSALALRSRWGGRKAWALAALGAGVWLMSLVLRRLVSRA